MKKTTKTMAGESERIAIEAYLFAVLWGILIGKLDTYVTTISPSIPILFITALFQIWFYRNIRYQKNNERIF